MLGGEGGVEGEKEEGSETKKRVSVRGAKREGGRKRGRGRGGRREEGTREGLEERERHRGGGAGRPFWGRERLGSGEKNGFFFVQRKPGSTIVVSQRPGRKPEEPREQDGERFA